MAGWPSWEPTSTSPMQQSSPMLQSSSSQSSHEQQHQPSSSSMQPPGSTISTRTSLVETLQTCLNSNSSSPPATSRRPELGPARPPKRRSRASRRVPTKVLEATSGEFRDMVQRLTGVSSAAAAPLRPLPQRAAPVTTFIRPDRTPMMNNSSILNFSGISQVNAFSSQLFAPSTKGEFDGGSATFATSSPIVATAPASLPSWSWDSGPPQVSNSSAAFANEIVSSVGHVSTSTTSERESLIVLPDGSELSTTEFDAWLSGQDDT